MFLPYRPKSSVKTWIVMACVFSLVLAGSPGWAGDGNPPRAGQRWAVLIGIQKYKHANNLVCTVADVKKIAGTLKQRGRYSAACMLEMTDHSPERFQPSKKYVEAEVADLLAKIGPDDTLLFYFSGHGFLAADGALYLAPNDCDPREPAKTGISLQWLREQLSRCKARVKLLVLDACHSGSAKGGDGLELRGMPRKELGDALKGVAGIYTLASSTADEASLIWEDVKQSLFSYWLNLGLRGHADLNGDAKVTADELFDYVRRNVVPTAQTILGKPQTPVRIVEADPHGVPVVIELVPTSVDELVADMAEQLANTLRLKGVSKIGITDFAASATDSKLPADRAGQIGAAGRFFATELERRLTEKSKRDFAVAPNALVQKTLKANRLKPADLDTPRIKDMQVEPSEAPLTGIGRGRICVRTGQRITVQCELIDTETQEVLDTVGGTAELTESDWLSFGASAQLDRPTPTSASSQTSPPATAPATDPVAEWDRRAAAQRNPLQDERFPYRVKILVNGVDRLEPPQTHLYRGNDLYVQLSRGEVFQIQLENRSPERVFLRLLVDGMNTAPERIKTADGQEQYQPCQRVRPNAAVPWQIPAGASPTVLGFYSKTPAGVDEQVEGKRFTVVNVKESVLHRERYDDQIGLITAGFYSAVPKNTPAGTTARDIPSPIGVGQGESFRQAHLPWDDSVKIGELLAVVNIRYVLPEVLAELKKQQ